MYKNLRAQTTPNSNVPVIVKANLRSPYEELGGMLSLPPVNPSRLLFRLNTAVRPKIMFRMQRVMIDAELAPW